MWQPEIYQNVSKPAFDSIEIISGLNMYENLFWFQGQVISWRMVVNIKEGALHGCNGCSVCQKT